MTNQLTSTEHQLNHQPISPSQPPTSQTHSSILKTEDLHHQRKKMTDEGQGDREVWMGMEDLAVNVKSPGQMGPAMSSSR